MSKRNFDGTELRQLNLPVSDVLPDQRHGQQLQPLRIGAVAGGGIGGDEPIEVPRIQQQLLDVESQEAAAVAAEAAAEIRQRIAVVNEQRDQAQQQEQMVRQINTERLRLVNDVRCLLPRQRGVKESVQQEVRRALVPLVDTFYDAFRPFLTEAYDDVAVFRDCFSLAPEVRRRASAGAAVVLTGDEQLLRTSFELLMKESNVQGIDRADLALTSFRQLLFNDDPLTMLGSASGSIVAIILARNVLLMFSNTVIGAMTFGWLDLRGLTNLLCFVYHNCSLANIRNLLIYLNVAPENAQLFIQAIRNYNREQRQYIIMSIFLFGLNAIRQIQQNAGRITEIIDGAQQIIDGAQQYLNGVFNADGDNALPDPIQAPADQAAAAAAAALNAAAAAAAGAAAIAPPQQPAARPVFQIFVEAGTDIVTFIYRIFRNGWMKGLRLSKQCLRDIFKLYLVRQPRGQGLVCSLVNLTGNVTRWGVAAIQDRSAVLDPDRPNQEVIRLLAAVEGLGNDDIRDSARCENALYNFAQKLKGVTGAPATLGQPRGAVNILQQEPNDDSKLVYLAPEHLTALRTHFCQDYQVGGRCVVNPERLQRAFLGMRLFVFEQDMLENVVAANLVNPAQMKSTRDFNDTQGAVYSASQSIERFRGFILEDNETVTKTIFQKAKLRLQALANMVHEGTQVMGRQFEEPVATPAQVFARQGRRNRISTKEQMRSAIEAYVVGLQNDTEQKDAILQNLLGRLENIDFTGLEEYLLNQNPRQGIPQTVIEGLTQPFIAFMNTPIPAEIVNAGDAIRNAARSGLSRCAAVCTNMVVSSSGAVLGVAREGIQRVRTLFNGIVGADAVQQADAAAGAAAAAAGAAAAPGIEPNNDAAILVNIDNVANVDVIQPGLVSDSLGEDLEGGGRSHSRKRSASKRTRRNSKQSSKKLKRKSRRYQRRASSRKARK